MRVHPDLPSSPLTQMRMAARGLASKACRAANNPAPPLPRIRMSVLMTSIVGCRIVVSSYGNAAEPSWRTDRCLQATAGLYYMMLGLTRQSSRRLGSVLILRCWAANQGSDRPPQLTFRTLPPLRAADPHCQCDTSSPIPLHLQDAWATIKAAGGKLSPRSVCYRRGGWP